MCVVSGASQGIGANLAIHLASEGAKKIVLVARTRSKLEAVAQQINDKYPDTAVVFPVDCSDYNQVDKMAQSVVSEYGTPQILVNCAGAGSWKYLWEMSPEDIVGCMNGMLVGFGDGHDSDS